MCLYKKKQKNVQYFQLQLYNKKLSKIIYY